jgi:hypothetical protein
MQIPHANPSRITLSNLVKVQLVFSHQDNSKRSVPQCDHILQTAAGHQIDQTSDKTIRHLHTQDKTMTMIAELQRTNLALSNNKTAAQDRPSDRFHPTIQTKGILQPKTIMVQDAIPAHPTQQILYATTVEDLATMLIDA